MRYENTSDRQRVAKRIAKAALSAGRVEAVWDHTALLPDQRRLLVQVVVPNKHQLRKLAKAQGLESELDAIRDEPDEGDVQ